MLNRLLTLSLALLLPFFMTGSYAQEEHHDHSSEQDSHEGHDHDSLDHEDHSGHDHEAHEGEEDGHDHSAHGDEQADAHDHADHEDGLIVELSPEAAALAGLKTSNVVKGIIGTIIELPGEVGFNEDRLVHISPRFAGIALDVKYRVGDYVETGSAMATVESNESMNSYTIEAPMSGWVIERHITPGEFVSEESSIFVIADLTTVWVNLAVYPKDFDQIRKGQEVRIRAIGSEQIATGTVDYITPIIDFRTRSATARVTLRNPRDNWRPGTFVQASLESKGEGAVLVVERDAIQYLSEASVVFVVEGPNKYTPVEVTTGRSDMKHVEILGGLTEGTKYVSSGAFVLKAKIVTSNLDAHAGHGH